MSTSAKDVWQNVSPQVRQEITEEIHRILQEVIHEHFRFDSSRLTCNDAR